MQFIEQADRRRNCGQIALAALTDIPLEEATRLIGHNHGTRSKELIRALRFLDYECPDKWQSKSVSSFGPTAFGIAQLHIPSRSGWHWVAVGRGCAWDGLRSGPMALAEYEKYRAAADNGRLTSFLPVTTPSLSWLERRARQTVGSQATSF